MGKWIKRIIFVLLLGVFLFSVGSIGVILYQYRQINENYAQVADQFVQAAPQTGVGSTPGTTTTPGAPTGADDNETPLTEPAPLIVDFAALQAANPDIIGWIYCEGTAINYPVLHGATNDTYLRHLYDHSYSISGSIFVEAANRGNFLDGNTIIYGHYMKNGSMFGALKNWADRGFYEEHPVIWLFTPEQDYRIEILGTYTTSAYSDTYTIYSEPGMDVDAYIERMLTQSVITTDAEPEPGARYVLLSTCAYVFDNARTVLHGKLVPVNSAGGIVTAN